MLPRTILITITNWAFILRRWSELKDFLRQRLGYVGHVEILTHPNGRSKGCAIVEFDSTVHAARAIQVCNGQELNGRRIVFREDRESKSFGMNNTRIGNNPPRQASIQSNNKEALMHPQDIAINNSSPQELFENVWDYHWSYTIFQFLTK